MKFLFAIASVLAAPNAQLCEVLSAANSGAFTPRQLCEAYNGTSCAFVKSMPEAVCRAGGGSFCDGTTIAQAICRAGGGSFCDGVKDQVEAMCRVQNGSFCDNPPARDRLHYWQSLQRCWRGLSYDGLN